MRLSAAVGRCGLIAALALVAGCGGSDPTPPLGPSPSPSPTPTPGPPPLTATVVIGSNNAFAPPEVTISVGGRVTFVNQNNRAHDITSDPLHLHTDCPPIIDVG